MREDIKLSLIYLLILLGFELKSFLKVLHIQGTGKKRYIPKNRSLSVYLKQIFVQYLICKAFLSCQASCISKSHLCGKFAC